MIAILIILLALFFLLMVRTVRESYVLNALWAIGVVNADLAYESALRLTHIFAFSDITQHSNLPPLLDHLQLQLFDPLLNPFQNFT